MTCLPHLCNKELFNPLRVLQHTELQSQSGMPVLQGIQTGPKAKKSKVHQNKQVLVSSQSWYDPATSSSMSRRPWSVTRMRARPRFIYTQQDEPLQERQKYVWYPLTMYESSARAINCCVLGQQKQSQRPFTLQKTYKSSVFKLFMQLLGDGFVHGAYQLNLQLFESPRDFHSSCKLLQTNRKCRW